MKSSDKILSLINSFPVSASFKEVDTGKYIINNLLNSKQFGITDPADLAGLTIHDVRFCQPAWGVRYANAIAELDFRARENKSLTVAKHQFIDESGEVQLEEMTKFPVIGARGNILGIVTYRHDITNNLSPINLYRLYLNFYDVDKAIKHALIRLEIEEYFFTPPTHAQFMVLLLRSKRISSKEIAKFLGISDRTVESHLSALRNKITDKNLADVLSLVNGDHLCVIKSTRY